MFELIPALPDDVIGIVAKGEVRQEDYEDVLVPAVEAALAAHDSVKLLYVLGPDFTGFSGGAMWEDGKLGMGHLTKWSKIALVTDHEGMLHAVGAFGYVIPGKVKTFPYAEEAEASAWITA